MKDVFQVQDDIAGSIVGAAAYDLYLRGRYFWNQRGDEALHSRGRPPRRSRSSSGRARSSRSHREGNWGQTPAHRL